MALQGNILYTGVSEWTAGQIAHAADYARGAGLRPLVSNHPQYSLLARGIEKEIIPLREGLGQVVFSPLVQGVLTGKYQPGQPAPRGRRLVGQDQSARGSVLDPWVHDPVNDALPGRTCNG